MEDFQLSEHFSFFELTATANERLLWLNRDEALHYLPALRAMAGVLELVRGGRPLVVNSAFRSMLLNGATPGSSPTSQHPVGQAADVHRPGQDVDQLFLELLELAKSGRLRFGQLIDESAARDYGVSRWVHVSLGRGFWKPERCGEVLRKHDGADRRPIYDLITKIPQEAP